MDITHFRGSIYLTLIDCGPSRYAIWWPLKYHSSTAVSEQLESIFGERGAPEELLTHNDTAFRSKVFDDLVKKWGIRLRFRCAYVPSGNGIIERCHRTVKVIAARKECGISEAVYWYKLRPRDDCSEATAPANAIYRYPVRVCGIDPVTHDVQDVSNSFVEGDLVWVRQPGGRCDSQFAKGTITKILSDQTVEVDGMARHVKDIRHRSSHAEYQGKPTTSRDESDDEMLLYLTDENQAAETNSLTGTVTSPQEPEDEVNQQQEQPQETEPRRSTRRRRTRHYSCCDWTSGESVSGSL
uniref:Integrase catalytic domain-containing protein n=1 Tax=Trichuris muris TaxID=70415 RepID=A0A5S6QCI9_TRIMR